MIVVSGLCTTWGMERGQYRIFFDILYLQFCESDLRRLLSSREVKNSHRDAYTKQRCAFGIA